MYDVAPFVRDHLLKDVLNVKGRKVFRMFRNSPDKSGEETTTVIFRVRATAAQRCKAWALTMGPE